VGLTEYFEHRSVENLFLQPPEWFAKHQPSRFTYYLGEKVDAIDTANKCVTTSKGRRISYDIAVFSTGSAASFPPYVSPEKAYNVKGIFVYRSIADLNSILAYGEKPNVNHCAVIGGGLLGLEAAKAVYDMPSCVLALELRHAEPSQG
jgi:nitrite reductase (NAD(P)H)